MFRPSEREIVRSEGRAALRDAWALLGGLMTALGFADLVGYEFQIPPLKIVLYHWEAIAHWIWSRILFFYPVHLPIHAAPLTFLAIMSGMFLRGRYARYASLAGFTAVSQARFFKGVFWLLALVFLIRLAPPFLFTVESRLSQIPNVWLVACLVLLGLVAIYYGLVILYLNILRSTGFVLWFIRRPYLIALFVIVAVILGFLAELQSRCFQLNNGVGSGRGLASMGLYGCYMLLMVSIFPLSFWYIRVFIAVLFIIASLFTIDWIWGVLGPMVAAQAA